VLVDAFIAALVLPRFAAGFTIGITLHPGHIRTSAEDSDLLMPSMAALECHYGARQLPVPATPWRSDCGQRAGVSLEDHGRPAGHRLLRHLDRPCE
jgi:hypothetical protein